MYSSHYRKGKRLCYGTTQARIQQSKLWGWKTLKRNMIGYQGEEILFKPTQQNYFEQHGKDLGEFK